mmetsp:Transcript_41926/g.138994  ORF Transcript_41926/g.138994 Transcript_41926/m.138994 type:complete len:266 (+) Transcript_41926:102-899(+)
MSAHVASARAPLPVRARPGRRHEFARVPPPDDGLERGGRQVPQQVEPKARICADGHLRGRRAAAGGGARERLRHALWLPGPIGHHPVGDSEAGLGAMVAVERPRLSAERGPLPHQHAHAAGGERRAVEGGERRAHVHAPHVGQLHAQASGKGRRRVLGGGVRREERDGQLARHGRDDEEARRRGKWTACRGGGAAAEEREEGLAHAHNAEEVDGDVALVVAHREPVHPAAGAAAGVAHDAEQPPRPAPLLHPRVHRRHAAVDVGV